MYTEFIFLALLSFLGGVIFGKFFKKLNPFMMVLGALLFAGVIQWLLDTDNGFYQLVFLTGALTNFKPVIGGVGKAMRKVKVHLATGWHKFFSNRSNCKKNKEKAARQQQARMRAEQELADLMAKLREQMDKLKQKKPAGPVMPKSFNEACDVLEVAAHVTVKEIKTARLKLLQLYHEDKCRHLGKRLQEQAKIETQRINMAWEIVKKQFQK